MSPRGNDAEAAAAELKAKLGASPNAEEMIQLANERYTPELRAANLRPVDQEATDELDEKKVQGFVGERDVLSYAVRGPFVVVVSADPEDGFTIKQAFALDEKKAEKLLPKEPEEEAEAEDADEDDADKSAAGAGAAKSGAKK